MAKSPTVGQVKTRLCPPLSLEEAARVAEAALADTLEAVARCGSGRRILALDGPPGDWIPAGFELIAQRGRSFDRRLAAAWSDAGGPGLQIGMDTPQVTPICSATAWTCSTATAWSRASAPPPMVVGGFWATAARAGRSDRRHSDVAAGHRGADAGRAS